MLSFLSVLTPENFLIFNSNGVSLDGFYEFLKGEAQTLLFIIFLIWLFVALFRRAYLQAVLTVIALSILSVFVVKPDLLKGLGEWIAGMFNIT